jgi:hypothetical protein
MQATPQMTQSIGVSRRNLLSAVDKIAFFPQNTRQLIRSSLQRESEMAAGT